MCFLISHMTPAMRIATEDIPCIKVLQHRRYKFGRRAILSPSQDAVYWNWLNWRKKKIKKRSRLERPNQRNSINKGLHTYRPEISINIFANIQEKHIAYIPKGAKYYMNNKEYVSNRLVVFKERLA